MAKHSAGLACTRLLGRSSALRTASVMLLALPAALAMAAAATAVALATETTVRVL